MSHLLKKYRGKVQLIYIDPPFDSKAEYKKDITLKGKTVSNDHNAFEEKQYSDIWTNDEYLQYIYERIILSRELLSDIGSIYIHCDWHKVHQIRCILDEIFGNGGSEGKEAGFKNEIIWKRTTAHSDSKQGAKSFGRQHDTILFYTKSTNYLWNQQYSPYDEDYIRTSYRMVDKNGRRFQTVDLTAAKPGGDTSYEWKGYKLSSGRYWAYSKKKMEEFDKENRIYYTKSGLPRLKYFLEDMPGVPLQDLWYDIKFLSSQSNERINYPTQKPEDLLERVIKNSSNPGDLVFDCFMGSGTTQAVAMKLGRRFIGADINLGAIQITTKRLINIAKELKEKQESAQQTLISDESEEDKIDTFYTGFSVYNVNNYDIFRNPVQAKELLIEALEIQPLPANTVYDGEKDGRMVKIMPVNRIATRADLNDLITNFDYKSFEKRDSQNPGKPVESLLLVCMGHEPDLKAVLENEVKYKLDIEIVDILRDRAELQFKRDSEAEVKIVKGNLEIKKFYPMNLLHKLSLMKEKVDDWRELVESVMIDWNYDGSVFEPAVVDVPGKNELVQGKYKVPEDAGTIRVKITDLLSVSWEGEVSHG